MSRLPRITGLDLIRALKRMGFYVCRKKGSHQFLRHSSDPERFAVVAVHSGETIPPKTLATILKTARVTVEELRNHL